jgi:SNF2 family DNA or RNA helicase
LKVKKPDTSIPSPGQLVIVRNRPARIIDVRPFSGQRTTCHVVELRYCDGWFHPETESVIWEYELGRKIHSKLSLPNIDQPNLSPDNPDVFNAYLQALKWTNHSSLLRTDSPEIISPWFSAVQIEDYQLYPVMKSILAPRITLLLADDVGLGKTIQAGLILSELLRRRKIRRVLIICPASLQSQWQEEMEEKFNIDFSIINLAESNKIYKEMGLDTNPWKAKQRVITSMDYLRQPDIMDKFISSAESLFNSDTPTMPWDLLIVDEAHNMSPAGFGQESQRFLMLQQVSRYFENRLFLTATPHNGYTMSFTTLLSLLDPVRFSPKAKLEDEDRVAINEVMIRRLKSELNRGTDPPRFPLREVQGVPVDLTEKELALFEALTEYRNKALSVLASQNRRERNLGKFLFSLLTKRLLSSCYAFARTWWQHVEGVALEEDVDTNLAEQVQKRAEDEITDDEERRSREEDAVRYGAAWMRLFGKYDMELDSYRENVNKTLINLGWTTEKLKIPLEQIKDLPEDGRWDALNKWVQQYLKKDTEFRDDERLILFTEYLDTLNYLQRRFDQEGITDPFLQILYGDSGKKTDLPHSPGKLRDLIKKEFNTEDSPLRILLATDVASEGLNFQYYCRYVFHQDIPWNPMRLEQRNGRVDRHNQARDVFVFHYDTKQQSDLEFLSRVLKKVNQVREDLGSVGKVFDEALQRNFSLHGKPTTDMELDRRITDIRSSGNEKEDLTACDHGETQIYRQAYESFKSTAKNLDISPDTLSHLFTEGMRLAGGKVEEVEPGIYRIVTPPPEFKQLIDETLIITRGRLQGSLPKVGFDTAIFEQEINGRKIYRTKIDTVLLRLNHPLMKRLLGLFEKHMWGEDKINIRRWTVVKDQNVKNPIFSIYCLFQVTNNLREILHTDILSLSFELKDGKMHPVDYSSNNEKILTNEELISFRSQLSEIWLDYRQSLIDAIQQKQEAKSKEVTESALTAIAAASEELKIDFDDRKKYLKSQKGAKSLEKLRDQIEKQELKLLQGSLFSEEVEARERELREQQWQLEAHEQRINAMLDYVEREEKRILNHIIPSRYTISNVDLQPVAVKIIIGE